MSQINRIAIVGETIVTSESEALEAARFALDWNGSSESDTQAECFVAKQWKDDECVGWEVIETWGDKANRSSEGAVLAEFKTEAEADAFANAHNDAALKSWSKCDWIDLPLPVDFIFFGGCTRGKYPHSRIATITARIGTRDIEAWSCANAPFIRDTHSHAALKGAVENLVEKLSQPAPVAVEEEIAE